MHNFEITLSDGGAIVCENITVNSAGIVITDNATELVNSPLSANIIAALAITGTSYIYIYPHLINWMLADV